MTLTAAPFPGGVLAYWPNRPLSAVLGRPLGRPKQGPRNLRAPDDADDGVDGVDGNGDGDDDDDDDDDDDGGDDNDDGSGGDDDDAVVDDLHDDNNHDDDDDDDYDEDGCVSDG